MPDRFDEFWAAYPHKVGKLKVPKAYQRALKIATHEEIMVGLERYKATKEPWRAWKGPEAWLNAGMWMDEPAETNSRESKVSRGEQSLETAAWKIRYGTGDGFQLDVSREQARACIEAGLVTEEQARPWL